MGRSNKLVTVLWKDLIMRRNHWLMTILELTVPLVCVVIINLTVPNETVVISSVHEESTFVNKSCNVSPQAMVEKVIYAPSNEFTDALMKKMACYAGYKLYHVTPGNTSDSEVGTYFYVQFDSIYNDNKFKYTIYPPTLLWSTNEFWKFDHSFSLVLQQKKSQYLELQHAIDVSYIELVSEGSLSYPGIELKTIKDIERETNLFQISTTLSTVIALTFLVPVVVSRIVQEKFCGSKELMLMMGLKKWHIWCSKFIDTALVFMFVLTGICGFLFVPLKPASLVFTKIPFLILWIVYILGVVAFIMFLFFMSCLFKKPSTSTYITQTVWICVYLLYTILMPLGVITKATKLVFCLFPHICLFDGLNIMCHYESLGKVVRLTERLSGRSDSLTLLEIIIILIADTLLFALLTWYMDAVKPGKYGIPQPYLFFTNKSYWFPNKVDTTRLTGDTDVGSEYEIPSGDLTKGISVRGLRKVYQTNKQGLVVAVDNVNLNIYHGEITALLGHNGAGKTTTMSIITGMLPPTCGDVVVNGYSILTDLTRVRESMGLCPQQDMLFDDLTCRQILMFYASIKGLSKHESDLELKTLLNTMKMEDCANREAKNLSGGQKRKLSLAIALIGGSKVLVLDEPTSGMDPEIRREIWEILTACRHDRTILITTHMMEEADAISDRIAIMDHGTVKCFGTPIFLKNKYGLGYKLSVVTKQEIKNVMDVVTLHVPSAQYRGQNAYTLTFQLNEESRSTFSQLFNSLEREKIEERITSYSLAITTLEDVFLRVREISIEEQGLDEVDHSSPYRRFYSTDELNENIKNTGLVLLVHQFVALLIKKCVFFRQNIFRFLAFSVGVIILVLLPVCVFPQLVDLAAEMNKHLGEDRITYNMRLYDDSEVLLHGQTQLSAAMMQMVEADRSTARYVNDIDKELQYIYDKDLYRYERKVTFAVDNPSNNNRTKIMYNRNAVYSSLIALNLYTNSLLQSVTGGSGRIITTIDNSLITKEPTIHFVDTLTCFNNITSLPMYLGIHTLFYLQGAIHETSYGAKQLQLLLVTPVLYWTTHLLFDIFTFFLFFIFIIFFYVFSYDDQFVQDYPGEVIIAVVLWAICMLLVYYLISCFTKKESAAAILASIYYFIPTYILYLIRFLLPTWVFYLHPITILQMGFEGFSCVANDRDTKYILYLAVYALALFILLMLKESYLLAFCTEWGFNKVKKVVFPMQNKDSDVRQEGDHVRKLIYEKQQSREALLVNDLHCWYGVKNVKRAVCGVSFSVHHGECFGLLGVNGAGKSSTFKMLTGGLVPSHGDSYVGQDSVGKLYRSREYLRHIGYCPQTTGLILNFTGYELLRLFACLRGVKMYKLNDVVGYWLKVMELSEYSHKQCGRYSGGNQRKLNAAIALIGDPPAVFLDEPSSGVDPVSRRNIWNVLTSVKKSGQSIVLTSHSMDECEALCTRLAIMVSGQFMCVGELVTLKNKFGQGYSVQIMLKSSATAQDTAVIKSRVKTMFGAGVRLTDEHLTLLQYHISQAGVTWSMLYNGLEELKRRFDIIETYTASETTLEQIFMYFARQGNEQKQAQNNYGSLLRTTRAASNVLV